LLRASRGEIWVNATEAREWPPRRRFTIGHELGHWVLHRAGQTALFCRHGVIESETTKPAPPVPEDEANRFAAALLMPARLMTREYANDPDFERLCGVFDASGAAMGRRLHAVIPRREAAP
jgi:Zn-dependent peptidase ImmA (M78 family)